MWVVAQDWGGAIAMGLAVEHPQLVAGLVLSNTGIAVPAGKDAQGLPLGLQLIGRPFDEETLFSLAHVVEQVA